MQEPVLAWGQQSSELSIDECDRFWKLRLWLLARPDGFNYSLGLSGGVWRIDVKVGHVKLLQQGVTGLVKPHPDGGGGCLSTSGVSSIVLTWRHVVLWFLHILRNLLFTLERHYPVIWLVTSLWHGPSFDLFRWTSPVAQLVERWTPGGESPGFSRSGARYMNLLTRMAQLVGAAAAVEVSWVRRAVSGFDGHVQLAIQNSLNNLELPNRTEGARACAVRNKHCLAWPLILSFRPFIYSNAPWGSRVPWRCWIKIISSGFVWIISVPSTSSPNRKNETLTLASIFDELRTPSVASCQIARRKLKRPASSSPSQ